MNLEKTLKFLEKEIQPLFDNENTGHDIYHLVRVKNLALHIAEKEGGDKFVIGVGAYLHDIHRVIHKNSIKYCTPKESLPLTESMLNKIEISDEIKSKILHCVEFHEEYNFSKSGKTASDLETLVIQDADNLDAMGAVGIGRAFTYGGCHNMQIWDPKIPFGRDGFDENQDDQTTIHHFHHKSLKLNDNFNTETAKAIARERHIFLENFLEQFFAEWNGDK